MSNSIRFTKQQVELLQKQFPAPVIKPNTSKDELMYAAGAHSVVQFALKNCQELRAVFLNTGEI